MIKLNQQLTKNLKKDTEKIFYKKIDKIIHSLIGHKLITFTVIDEKLKFCERVYAFEPVKKTFSLLEENTSINKVKYRIRTGDFKKQQRTLGYFKNH